MNIEKKELLLEIEVVFCSHILDVFYFIRYTLINTIKKNL